MFDAVIKLGGSLSKSEADLRGLCEVLGKLAYKHKFLVIPGGGGAADCVRNLDKRFGLSDDASHWMAILAMDQYGLLLEDLTENSRSVTELNLAEQLSFQGFLPILLPFNLMKHLDPLPHSWEVTSDSIALWLAYKTNTKRLILLKSLDGVFCEKDEKKQEIIHNIDLKRLVESHIVDGFFSGLISDKELDCWIINGAKPKRLARLMAGQKIIGTRFQA